MPARTGLICHSGRCGWCLAEGSRGKRVVVQGRFEFVRLFRQIELFQMVQAE